MRSTFYQIIANLIPFRRIKNKFKLRYCTSSSFETLTNKRIDLLQRQLFDLLNETCIFHNQKRHFDAEVMLKSSTQVVQDSYKPVLAQLWNSSELLSIIGSNAQLPDYVIIHGSGNSNFDYNYSLSQAMMLALQLNIPLIKKEDGFLHSADTWVNKRVPSKYTEGISFTFSPDIHYFDATASSYIERLINDKNLIIDTEKKKRAKNCIQRIVDTHLTKYNHQPIYTPKLGRENVTKVLIVDQSYGDFSISRGMANEETFKIMLETAIKNHPEADIIIKTHPDALTKGTTRNSGYFTHITPHDNIYTITEPINPISLIKHVDKVYVCTTQLGFEALMCNKDVYTFGMPFYAGWGLTHDYLKCERRNNVRSLEEIFYIAYIMYSFYVNPQRKCRCEIEEAMDYLLELRDEYFLKYNVRNDSH